MPVAYFKDSKRRSEAKRNESAALQRTNPDGRFKAQVFDVCAAKENIKE